MRIGIDIDDVITDTSSLVIEYINKYDDSGKLHECIEDVMRGDNPTPLIKSFYQKHSGNIFKNVKLKDAADKTIHLWLEKGYEIFLITTRGENNFKNSEQITLDYLKENNIKYTKILFNCYDKANACIENHIDVMIDDSVKYCEEVKNKRIPSILFTSKVNKSISTNITRVNNWEELKLKISKM